METPTTPTPGTNPTEPGTGNLYQRLHRMLEAVTTVPKRGRNDAGEYDFATDGDVKAATRPLLLRERLLLIPTLKAWQVDQAQGNAYAVMTFRLVNIDVPTEYYDIDMIGSGNDWTPNGMRDKAIYKALTGAMKYAILQLCMLKTGEDPENARAEEFHRQQQTRTSSSSNISNAVDSILTGAVRTSAPASTRSSTPPTPAPVKTNGIPPFAPLPAVDEPEPPVEENDSEIEQLLKQSLAQQARQEEAPPAVIEEESEEAVWGRLMRRQAEDARTSQEITMLWNSNKEGFRRLNMTEPKAYLDLHNIFKLRLNQLKARIT